jgi:NADH-quinone oxidoreductase subunit J
MHDPLLLAAPASGEAVSSAETAAFWVLACLAVLAAVGMVLSKKAVHSALMLAAVMMILAVLYGIQQAPFLMVVQIVVYTGAVLMLFLFVLMLVGVSSADSLVETLKGQRFLAGLGALGFLAVLAFGLSRVIVGAPVGLGEGAATAGGNVPWLATELFHRYIIAFEATGALLIVAVLGALVLAHAERFRRRAQKEMSKERIRSDHPTPLPGPGTYARHNAIDTPGLLPDGTPSELTLNPVLQAREERRTDTPDRGLPEEGSARESDAEGDDAAPETGTEADAATDTDTDAGDERRDS